MNQLVNKNSKVLVVAAHPDDEVLGCGATIASMSKKGADVRIAFLSDGISSRPGSGSIDKTELEVRQNAAKKSSDILGAKILQFGEFPDNKMDSVPLLTIVKHIEKLIEGYRPEIVMTHFSQDLNIDHRLTYEAVITACRPLVHSAVKTILSFEILSSSEWRPGFPSFSPNWFFDISDSIKLKIEALEAYKAEMRSWPHPRSIEGVLHQASLRGASVGCTAAEAFELVRSIS